MTLRIGAIGIGGLGEIQANAIRGLEGAEVAAAADVDVDRLAAFAEEFGVPTFEDYEAMLDEVALDAVTIVTPHALHYEQAKAALERDLHVHLEKPLVIETANALELIELAEERDRVFQVGYQRHFHPAYRELRRLIDEGRIGEPHMASCFLGQDWISGQEGAWRSDPALSGGGQLIDSGSHLLDALLWTTDTEPAHVAAITDHWDHDVDVNSAVSATLVGGSRPLVASIGVTGDGHSFEEQLSIWGTEGRLAYDGHEITVEEEDGGSYTAELSSPGYVELNERKLEAFVDAIRTGGESPVPAEFGLRVTRLTEAAFEAAATGETVDAREL